MSGQPYKYITDITKYRTEYLESLGLQADINALNLDANKTYKATGQLPAVSQMKDTRTTSEILADTLKLKNNIISSIGKISSVPFGQLVVQRIIDHPLNSDNKLLVFTAQRIDDIVSNITKLYKYGIKGDSNDAEQFVNFIATMYNDKNAIVAQTKSFMDRQGIKSLSNVGPFTSLYENLVKIGATLINYRDDIHYIDDFEADNDEENYTDELNIILRNIKGKMGDCVDYIGTLKDLIPTNPNMVSTIEDYILTLEMGAFKPEIETIDEYSQGSKTTGNPSEHSYANSEPASGFSDVEDWQEVLENYLDFLNLGLPNTSTLASIIKNIITNWGMLDKSKKYLESVFITLNNEEGAEEAIRKTLNSPLYNASIENGKKLLESVIHLKEALNPKGFWVLRNLKKLKTDVSVFMGLKGREMKTPEQVAPPINVNVQNIPQIANAPNVREPEQAVVHNIDGVNIPDADFQRITELIPLLSHSVESANNPDIGLSAEEVNELVARYNNIVQILGHAELRMNGHENLDDMVGRVQRLIDYFHQQVEGHGFRKGKGITKRRGRPKGSGISKPKPYKESVKAHSVLDKGIMETPRFIKFGKYLLNNHKLNNENIFALKRPSGGNIVELPSIKISDNLSGVIKKMLGGSIPTYSDISKLSEPEKAYLHKISQKSNILDKFDIPAPSKDQKEKDIHEFEVLKGEIMAGNDSKELIKKFKLHIMKLSKNGTLPKNEVHEILSELIELGF